MLPMNHPFIRFIILNETIRIVGIDAPELNELGGQQSKEQLEEAIGGKNVHCVVQTRDDFHRVVADVHVM